MWSYSILMTWSLNSCVLSFQIPFMEYNRKSLRAKLSCLERSMKEGSSLSLEGRTDSALATLKGKADRLEEMIGWPREEVG